MWQVVMLVGGALILLDFICANLDPTKLYWSWPILHELPNVIRNFYRFHDFCVDHFTASKKKSTVLRLGNHRIVGVVDPDDVRHMLQDNWKNYVVSEGLRGDALHDFLGHGIFNADGNHWYMQRKISSREFNAGRFREHTTAIFINAAQRLLQFVDEREGEHLDLQNAFFRLTLDSFCCAAFGKDVGALEGKPIPFARAFDRAQEICAHRMAKSLPMIWKMKRLLSIGTEKELRQCNAIIHQFVKDLISSKRAQSDSGEDLLSRLMRVAQEDTNKTVSEDAYLLDMTVNFIIAGRDTTACALSWLMWELTQHPAVLKRLQDEIEEVYQGRSPTYDSVSECQFLTACIYEALRLHPSVPFDIKTAINGDTMPSGTIIKPGDSVAYMPYVMGRLDSVWGADARAFKPERWLNDRGVCTKPDPYKYPVFQAGPRQCLGIDLAMLEMRLVSVVLIQRYTFKAVNTPHYRTGLVLQMSDGFFVTASRRQKGPSQ